MLAREKIEVINLTSFPSHDEFNHGKFAEDPKVVELIGSTLASGQTLTDSRRGIWREDHANDRRGRRIRWPCCRLVVSAPVAIIDPDTAEHYDDQIDQFTQSIHNIGPHEEH